MEIERAIRIMLDEYSKALGTDEELIDDPVSFAAWKTWRHAERDRFDREEKKNAKKDS